jgi:DNA polymerase-3 subunit alpha/error-prone DNA polymerase
MLGYLISRKQVPTARGTMYFGTWVDHEGTYFDTTHFPDNLIKIPFSRWRLLFTTSTVELITTSLHYTILKMAKLPFVPDPRYSDSKGSSIYHNNR